MEVGEGDDKQSWSRNIWAAAEVGSEASSSFLVLVLSCKLHTAVPFSRVFSGAFGSSPEMTHVHSNITLSPRGDRGRGEHHVVRLQMHPCMTAQEMPVIPTCQIRATLLCRAQGRDSGSLQELLSRAYPELFTAQVDNTGTFAHRFPQRELGCLQIIPAMPKRGCLPLDRGPSFTEQGTEHPSLCMKVTTQAE